MIVLRTAQVKEALAEAESLKRAEAEAVDIKATFDELQTLHAKLIDIKLRHQRTAPRLGAGPRNRISDGLAQLVADAVASRTDFLGNARQAVAIRRLVTRAGELQEQLDAAWQSAANEEAFAYAELLQLVEALPEMQSRIAALRRLRNNLRQLAERAPEDDDELAVFDDNLQRLRDELERIEGLTPTVQTFLRAVVEGNATLADLSDEVLEWCRHGDRGRSFHLQLAGPQ